MSNDKQPTTIEQVEHHKAYAVNHYKDLPLDVLKYIAVLIEFTDQQTKALNDELTQFKEHNKQLAEALQEIQESVYSISIKPLTDYQKQTK